MQIKEYENMVRPSCKQKTILINTDMQVEESMEELISEYSLDIYVNEHFAFQIMCTPDCLTELVLGRLLCEGMIASIKDIKYLVVDKTEKTAAVYLNQNKRTDADMDTGIRKLKPVLPIRWKKDWIFKLSEEFRKDLPLHRATHSTHGCYLMVEGEILFTCEDIKRHNVVDKMIGYALRTGIDLKKAVVYISGRMPTDMVRKIICAGIPLLVSKELPTKEAVELAGKYNLTIIGGAKDDKFKIFTKPGMTI